MEAFNNLPSVAPEFPLCNGRAILPWVKAHKAACFLRPSNSLKRKLQLSLIYRGESRAIPELQREQLESDNTYRTQLQAAGFKSKILKPPFRAACEAAPEKEA